MADTYVLDIAHPPKYCPQCQTKGIESEAVKKLFVMAENLHVVVCMNDQFQCSWYSLKEGADDVPLPEPQKKRRTSETLGDLEQIARESQSAVERIGLDQEHRGENRNETEEDSEGEDDGLSQASQDGGASGLGTVKGRGNQTRASDLAAVLQAEEAVVTAAATSIPPSPVSPTRESGELEPREERRGISQTCTESGPPPPSGMMAMPPAPRRPVVQPKVAMQKLPWTRILIPASDMDQEMTWEKEDRAIDTEELELLFFKPPIVKKSENGELDTKEKIQDTKDMKQQNLENKEEEETTGFPKAGAASSANDNATKPITISIKHKAESA